MWVCFGLLTDEATLDKMMLTNPHGLVKFQAYTRKDNTENVGMIDRRKNRVRNKNSKNPPIDMWAHYLLESILFKTNIRSFHFFYCPPFEIKF